MTKYGLCIYGALETFEDCKTNYVKSNQTSIVLILRHAFQKFHIFSVE